MMSQIDPHTRGEDQPVIPGLELETEILPVCELSPVDMYNFEEEKNNPNSSKLTGQLTLLFFE